MDRKLKIIREDIVDNNVMHTMTIGIMNSVQ